MKEIILKKMSKTLEETRPVKYQELIMTGTINEILESYSQEIASQEQPIEEQLRTKYQKPDTDEFIALAQYENMIRSLKMELMNNMIEEKVKEM